MVTRPHLNITLYVHSLPCIDLRTAIISLFGESERERERKKEKGGRSERRYLHPRMEGEGGRASLC